MQQFLLLVSAGDARFRFPSANWQTVFQTIPRCRSVSEAISFAPHREHRKASFLSISPDDFAQPTPDIEECWKRKFFKHDPSILPAEMSCIMKPGWTSTTPAGMVDIMLRWQWLLAFRQDLCTPKLVFTYTTLMTVHLVTSYSRVISRVISRITQVITGITGHNRRLTGQPVSLRLYPVIPVLTWGLRRITLLITRL